MDDKTFEYMSERVNKVCLLKQDLDCIKKLQSLLSESKGRVTTILLGPCVGGKQRHYKLPEETQVAMGGTCGESLDSQITRLQQQIEEI